MVLMETNLLKKMYEYSENCAVYWLHTLNKKQVFSSFYSISSGGLSGTTDSIPY